MEEITIRAFMRKGTFFVSGALGAAALGTLGPHYAAAGKPRTAESRCGLPGEKPKVLVACGSMHGSTAKVAETVALTLCSAGELRPRLAHPGAAVSGLSAG